MSKKIICLLFLIALTGCGSPMQSLRPETDVNLTPNQAVIIVGLERSGLLLGSEPIVVTYNTLLASGGNYFEHKDTSEKSALAFVVPVGSKFMLHDVILRRVTIKTYSFSPMKALEVTQPGIYYYGTIYGGHLRKLLGDMPAVSVSIEPNADKAHSTMQLARSTYPKLFTKYQVMNYQ